MYIIDIGRRSVNVNSAACGRMFARIVCRYQFTVQSIWFYVWETVSTQFAALN